MSLDSIAEWDDEETNNEVNQSNMMGSILAIYVAFIYGAFFSILGAYAILVLVSTPETGIQLINITTVQP